ncbi:MAG: radical SAM protein [Turicibacter sp.]|nr:radical SAM protein [Turicibacter sp.]
MNFGFYGRLTQNFPSQIIVDVCEACNYECIHCPQSRFKHSEEFSGAFLDENMNKKMVDEVADFGLVGQIRYTAMGEPLLHPKIMDLLEYAVKHSQTLVSLTTNGSLLDNGKTRQLLEMNVGLIDFSLDAASAENYEKIRRGGNFATVKDNVLQMIDLKRKLNAKTRIVISFVEQAENAHEVADFRRFWEENGADFVIIRKLHSAGGFFHKIENTDVFPCVYPWERIVLGAKGNLGFCPASWEGSTTIHENYEKTTIKAVWNSEIYTKLRTEHLSGKYDKFAVCKNCPDRHLTIWPAAAAGEHRGYGDMIQEIKENKS